MSNKVDGTSTLDHMASARTKLRRIAREIESRPQVIEEARQEGATWEQIAEDLNMSRYGAIKLYNNARDIRAE